MIHSREQGVYWIISFDIVPHVASEYQEMHPYSAMNIDSQYSLITMRKWFFYIPSDPEISLGPRDVPGNLL